MFHVKQPAWPMKLIAIDGPGGVGKSTVARSLAEALGYYFLSSGMVYRAMAWYMRGRGWRPPALPELGQLAEFSIRIDGEGGLWIDGSLVTDDLHSEEISAATSLISELPAIRDKSNEVQRRTVRRIEEEASHAGVILEGRDIGTVVFPDATHKFFLIAGESVRAERRFREQQAENPTLTLEAVREALRERDHRDQTRAVAPLRAAEDATVVDTSTLSQAEVVRTMLDTINTAAR